MISLASSFREEQAFERLGGGYDERLKVAELRPTTDTVCQIKSRLLHLNVATPPRSNERVNK
ncbi:hypothetical protein B0G81_3959 [Paraburkholderia sp. BL6665CI2N2]|nr:hypothetical protein B0G81_3959 [Paraburkholderia sp. BL6665CI2N2]